MLRIGTVVLGVDDVGRAAEFWSRALGYVPRDEVEEDWAVMVPASGPGTHLALQLSQTPVQEHPRVHLDLYAGWHRRSASGSRATVVDVDQDKAEVQLRDPAVVARARNGRDREPGDEVEVLLRNAHPLTRRVELDVV